MAASKEDVVNAIIQGTEVTADLATMVAPIVAIYNPAAGAALQVLAPFVEKFIVSEAGMVLQFKAMSIEEQRAALTASKFTI